MLLFADDAVVFYHEPTSVQSILNDIEIYSNISRLRLNINKTKIMIFENKSHRPTTYDFFLYNKKIEIVQSFKYLGVYFLKNGNWKRNPKLIAQNTTFCMHNLFTVFNQIDIPTSHKLYIFDSLVLLILNYSAEIWGIHPCHDIESVFLKFCRRVLCIKPSTNLNAIYGELGRTPMTIHRNFIIIKYWIKILSSKRNSLMFKTYYMLKVDVDRNCTYRGNNWAFYVKQTLEKIGMRNIWDNQFNMDIQFKPIKERIMDIFKLNWHSSINNSSRLSTFKHIFEYKKYLDIIHESKYSISLTRLRLSSHESDIESGRKHNIPENERTSKNCNLGLKEKEYHFLLVCPKFSYIRSKYTKNYNYISPTIQKIENFLSSPSKTTIGNLAKFIFLANKFRT